MNLNCATSSSELLAVGPSLLLLRRRGTLCLTIYEIYRVAIVILDVS